MRGTGCQSAVGRSDLEFKIEIESEILYRRRTAAASQRELRDCFVVDIVPVKVWDKNIYVLYLHDWVLFNSFLLEFHGVSRCAFCPFKSIYPLARTNCASRRLEFGRRR